MPRGWPSASEIAGARWEGEWSLKVPYPKPWGTSGAYFCKEPELKLFKLGGFAVI